MNWKNLFKKNTVEKNNREPPAPAFSESGSEENMVSTSKVIPKFPQPKILLVDIQTSASEALQGKGYNISTATLGAPYLVPHDSSLFIVDRNPRLPYDYKEHEIVIINLNYESVNRRDNFKGITSEPGINYWWVSHESGEVNPRLMAAMALRDDFDRILNKGGVFLVFASRIELQKFHWGHDDGYQHFQPVQKSVLRKNWDFLSLTSNPYYVGIGDDFGSQINLFKGFEKGALLAQLISKHLDDAVYGCTLTPGTGVTPQWLSILENKYGSTVGCVVIPNEERAGYLFILPNISDKVSFITEFVDGFLPTLVPALFPHAEKASWIDLPLYELENVQRLKEQIVEVREKAHSDIALLEQTIQEEKKLYSYLYDLTRESGDALAEAVMKTLATLGFAKIIDVDKALKEQGVQMQNREDLQIHDSELTLIVEVKGIGTYPSDDDALAVQKYVVLRMREWNKVTIQGISIINHQRHLPPLDRGNETPFRQEILDVATEQRIGLMTTWDLHRLARSFIKNNWTHENVRPLFYQLGRIQPIPVHYQYIGTIQRYIESISVMGIQVEQNTLQIEDRIAFELPVSFEEQDCGSMQIENKNVNEAKPGVLVGVKTHLTKQQAKLGTRVYRIKPPDVPSEESQ